MVRARSLTKHARTEFDRKTGKTGMPLDEDQRKHDVRRNVKENKRSHEKWASSDLYQFTELSIKIAWTNAHEHVQSARNISVPIDAYQQRSLADSVHVHVQSLRSTNDHNKDRCCSGEKTSVEDFVNDERTSTCEKERWCHRRLMNDAIIIIVAGAL